MPPGARPGGVCRFFRHLKQAWSCAPGLCRVGSQAADVALVSGTGKIGHRSRGLLQVPPGLGEPARAASRADGELETRSSDHRCPGKRPLRFFGVNFADKTAGGGLPARRSSWGPCGLPRSHGARLTVNSAILDA